MAKKLPRRPGGPGSLPPPPKPAGPGKPPRRPGGAPPPPPPRGTAKSRPSGPPARRVRRTSSGSSLKLIKVLLLAVAVLVLLAAAGGGYIYYTLSRSLPQVEGVQNLSGLSAPVEVLRDSSGVPHLFGADIRDLARAMGFVHAQDRFFQMELSRRSGTGRLAEIFGADAVAQDRRMRRMGLVQAATSEWERAAPEAREILEAYASGVNAYLTAHAERLPPEFRLLGLSPGPWQATDSLVIGKSMSLFLSYNGTVEMLRQNLAGAIGLPAAYALTGLALPPGSGESGALAPRPFRVDALDEAPPGGSPFGRVLRGASNAWVVSGARSATGRPLLASDPHLPLSMPSVWYEIHLSGGGYEVAGASIPGLPLVLIGRNRRIAWGVTALFADVQDLYVETVNPDNPRQYLAGESWLDFDVVVETIPVKDASPVTEEVRVTRHGVVVSETSDGRLLAQKWDSLWSGDHMLAALKLNRAGSWEEFTEALRTWASPPLSFLYADVEGNIGFFPAGEIPVRAGFDGTFPVDGASGTLEWQGVVPHELKPMVFNPADGLLVSANHAMLPPETPYPLGADTIAPFRASRIRELLRSLPQSSLDDFARIQNDRYDSSTESVLRLAVGLNPTDERSRRAVEALRVWNGQMTDGPAPAIYQAFYRRLLENALADEIGEELFASYLDFVEIGHPGGIYTILDDASSHYWDDRRTPEVESRERVLLKSLAEAVELLSGLGGEEVSGWDWRQLHGATFSHPLGAQRPFDLLFSRGPVPFGGSTHTIANSVVSLRRPFAATIGTSFRFLADLSNPDLTRTIVPTGASGHPLSPHYFDQNPDWLRGHSRPAPYERSSVESATRSKLLLQP